MAWLPAGLVFLVFNTMYGAGRLVARVHDPGSRLAFAFGQAVGLSLLIGLLAVLNPLNRNPRTLGKILFWTQIITFVAVVARS